MNVRFVRCESFEGDEEHDIHEGQQGKSFRSSCLHKSARHLGNFGVSYNYAVVPSEDG